MPGPPPKKNGERRRRNAPRANTVLLPKEGRKGKIPRWPLSTHEPARWGEVWRLPQAVMWEKQHVEMLVARFVYLEDRLADPESKESQTASFWGTLRELEDRLGMSPVALMKLQWEISGTAAEDVPASHVTDSEADIINLQDRAGFSAG